MNQETIDFRTIYREFKIFVVWAKRMQESFDEKFASLSEYLDTINGKCDRLMSERRQDTPLVDRRSLVPVVVLKKIDENVKQSPPRRKRGPRAKQKETLDAVSITIEEVVEQNEASKVESLKYTELVPVIQKIVKSEVIEENERATCEEAISVGETFVQSDVMESDAVENEVTECEKSGETFEKAEVIGESASVEEVTICDEPETVIQLDVREEIVCEKESANGKELESVMENFEKANVIEEIANENESIVCDKPESVIQLDVSEDSVCSNESTNGKKPVSEIEKFDNVIIEESSCENEYLTCVEPVSESDVMGESSCANESTECKEAVQVIDIDKNACEIINEVHKRKCENDITSLHNSPKKSKQSSLENYFFKYGPKTNNLDSHEVAKGTTDVPEVLSETILLEPKEVQSQVSRKRGRKLRNRTVKARKKTYKVSSSDSETDSTTEIIPVSSDQTREQLENLYKMNYKYSQDMIGILEVDVHLVSLEFQKYLKCKCESEEDVGEFFEETKRLMSEMLRIHKAWKHIKPQADVLLNKNEDLCRALLNVYVEAISKLNNREENNLMSSLKGWPNVTLITFRIEVDAFEQEVEDFLKRDFFEYNWKKDDLRTNLWDKYFILESKSLEIQADTEEILSRLKSTVHKINLVDILFDKLITQQLEHFGHVELIKKNCKNTGFALYYTEHHISTAEFLNGHLQFLEHLCDEYLNRQYDKEHFFEAQTLCTRSILIGNTAEKVHHDVKRFKKVSGELIEKVSKYYEATAPKDEVKRNLEIAKTKYGLNAKKYYNLFLGSKRFKVPLKFQVSQTEAIQLEELKVISTLPQELQVPCTPPEISFTQSEPPIFETRFLLDGSNALHEVKKLLPPQQGFYRKIAPALPNASQPGNSSVQPEVVPDLSWVLVQPHARPFILPKGKTPITIAPKVSHPVIVRAVPVVSNALHSVPFSRPSTSYSATIITDVQPSTCTLNPFEDPKKSNS